MGGTAADARALSDHEWAMAAKLAFPKVPMRTPSPETQALTIQELEHPVEAEPASDFGPARDEDAR